MGRSLYIARKRERRAPAEPADVAQMVGSIRIARDEFHYLFYAGAILSLTYPSQAL